MEEQIRQRRVLDRREKTADIPAPFSEELIQQQLAAAAGAEMFQHRDISYHLTENFCQTFDRVGQQKAVRALSEVPGIPEKGSLRLPPNSGLREFVPGLEHEPTTASANNLQNMQDSYRARPGQEERLQRFADMAFQRGRLSVAILQGTGKMMLFSCLRRTVGQEQSLPERERMLFQASSVHRSIPSGKGSVAVSNRGLAKSALGLVVDALQDSRQSLLNLTALAEGGGPGSETLLREYPFLSDAQERELLSRYRARLAELKGPGCEEERNILLMAEEKTLLQIQKKEQMKESFLQKLRQLSDQALQAQLLFSQTETQREAAQVIQMTAEAPDDRGSEPPEPPAGEDADGAGNREKPTGQRKEIVARRKRSGTP